MRTRGVESFFNTTVFWDEAPCNTVPKYKTIQRRTHECAMLAMTAVFCYLISV